MRASRLLRLLLQLQNRGRLTTKQLAAELEVTRRTVMRDVEALGEAGLPVVVHRGAKGGIELGFNYRSRLTGLTVAESEALGVWLGAPLPALEALGLGAAGHAARTKLLESLPDGVLETAMRAQQQFRVELPPAPGRDDPRLEPLSKAIREGRRVRIRARSAAPRTIHPVALVLRRKGWAVVDELLGEQIPLEHCGDLNISGTTFR